MRSLLALCFSLIVQSESVKRVIDGDTFVEFAITGTGDEEHIRVLDLNTPERNEPRWQEAKDSTTAWLRRGPFTLEACKHDSFGRLLALVYRGPDTLAVVLRRAGLDKLHPLP